MGGRHGHLVGLLRPRQPWHGGRITALARNEPDEECVSPYHSATNAGRKPGATSW